jgi:ubiquinone/menaquinone biosynthesis C-methylase UbiE
MAKEPFFSFREPKGIGGSILVWSMNWGHKMMAKWGLKHLNIRDNDCILDIGCGGGANIARMLKMASNLKLSGLDYSELCVKKALKYNKKAVDKKHCEIKQGSVSNIPYEETVFDIVTAFETTYFWPDIKNDAKEIFRVLKPGGTFFICNEDVRLDDDKKPHNDYFEKKFNLKMYSPKEFTNILSEIGFMDIQIILSKNKKLMCVIAKKT